MATLGCRNPKAVNYNPAADQEDYSCIYLDKVGGVCYEFLDVAATDVTEQSFTLSYSLEQGSWVFFHDYIPDFYFMTKTDLYSVKDKKVYKHNAGAPGVYYNSTPSSFFVDLVFTGDESVLLNSVQWLSEVFDTNGEVEFSTLTHITIWNNQQCTNRIPLPDIFSGLKYEVRKTQALWNFNDFRDLVKDGMTKFLDDIFHNFTVLSGSIDTGKPWFKKQLLQDNFFVIRLEFDNTSGNQIFLHKADINANESFR